MKYLIHDGGSKRGWRSRAAGSDRIPGAAPGELSHTKRPPCRGFAFFLARLPALAHHFDGYVVFQMAEVAVPRKFVDAPQRSVHAYDP